MTSRLRFQRWRIAQEEVEATMGGELVCIKCGPVKGFGIWHGFLRRGHKLYLRKLIASQTVYFTVTEKKTE